MKQLLRSERSRKDILDAALRLFSHRGYGATSVNDIAAEAGLSKGNVYHHFPDKESIFRALLDRYFQALSQPDFPFNRAMAERPFPENLEDLGHAARDTVRDYREYVALIYVDVVEFDGTHVRKFYEQMASRFEGFIRTHGLEEELRAKLQEDLSPTSAMMLAARIFYNYFSVEVLFGVKDHFGKDTEEVVGEISRILRRGMLRDPAAAASQTARPAKKARKRGQ